MTGKTEFQNFDKLVRKVLSVPHSEIKAKLDAEKRAKCLAVGVILLRRTCGSLARLHRRRAAWLPLPPKKQARPNR
jgi:hypothetical protein